MKLHQVLREEMRLAGLNEQQIAESFAYADREFPEGAKDCEILKSEEDRIRMKTRLLLAIGHIPAGEKAINEAVKRAKSVRSKRGVRN